MPRKGEIVAWVDGDGLIHDAVIVSVINDGKAPYGAVTLRSLDDDVEHSNVQCEADRPDTKDDRVVKGHISAGYWRPLTDGEVTLYAKYTDRRAKTLQLLADVDDTPKKDESPEETRKRVDAAKNKIYAAKTSQEPALIVDESPRLGEAPTEYKKRIAVAKEAAKRRE